MFATLAADVVLSGIREPVRFTIEFRARIYDEHERFWYNSRQPITEQYFLAIRPVNPRLCLSLRQMLADAVA